MPKADTTQNPIIAAIAAVSFNLVSLSSANAQEMEIYNPYYGGNTGGTVTLNCSSLKKGLTCDFVETLDGQEFCDDKKIEQQIEKRAQETNRQIDPILTRSNAVMLSAIDHNGRTHFVCTSRYARTHIRNLIDNYLQPSIDKGTPLTDKSKLDDITRTIRANISTIQEKPNVAVSLGAYTLKDFTSKTLESLEKSYAENSQISIEELEKVKSLYNQLSRHPVWDTPENKECIVAEAINMCRAHPDF